MPDSVFESFDIKTDNGNFKANQLEVKVVKVDNNNGDVRLKNIKSEIVAVTADNGSIHLVQVEGDSSGNTNNGSIRLSSMI